MSNMKVNGPKSGETAKVPSSASASTVATSLDRKPHVVSRANSSASQSSLVSLLDKNKNSPEGLPAPGSEAAASKAANLKSTISNKAQQAGAAIGEFTEKTKVKFQQAGAAISAGLATATEPLAQELAWKKSDIKSAAIKLTSQTGVDPKLISPMLAESLESIEKQLKENKNDLVKMHAKTIGLDAARAGATIGLFAGFSALINKIIQVIATKSAAEAMSAEALTFDPEADNFSEISDPALRENLEGVFDTLDPNERGEAIKALKTTLNELPPEARGPFISEFADQAALGYTSAMQELDNQVVHTDEATHQEMGVLKTQVAKTVLQDAATHALQDVSAAESTRNAAISGNPMLSPKVGAVIGSILGAKVAISTYIKSSKNRNQAQLLRQELKERRAYAEEVINDPKSEPKAKAQAQRTLDLVETTKFNRELNPKTKALDEQATKKGFLTETRKSLKGSNTLAQAKKEQAETEMNIKKERMNIKLKRKQDKLEQARSQLQLEDH